VADFTTTTIWHLDAGEQRASTPSKPRKVLMLIAVAVVVFVPHRFSEPGGICRLPYNPPPPYHPPSQSPARSAIAGVATQTTFIIVSLSMHHRSSSPHHDRTVLNRDDSGQAEPDCLLASRIGATALLRRLDIECILL
jgi:hypothetical protein